MVSSNSEIFIAELMKRYPPGFDLGLERIDALVNVLGDPHLKLPPIFHVAGTNGKGSTIAFMRAILEGAGYKVHVHTSPHLVRWHERFRIAGRLVADCVLLDALKRVSIAVEKTHQTIKGVTVFEIMTATAFLLFAEHPADAVLIEVGLGGEFDATNVIAKPAVSVITPIDMDHQNHLGDNLSKIAQAKAGIIKRNCPVALGIQKDEALNVLLRKAQQLDCPIIIQDQDFTGFQENGRFVYQDLNGLSDLPLPVLQGSHQIANATLAISALKTGRFKISDIQIAQGLQQVQWPGRLQLLPKGSLHEMAPDDAKIWIDGGHNPHAGRAVADFFADKTTENSPLIMIVGMLNTKDPSAYFRAFNGLVSQVFTVPISSSDAGINPENLAQLAHKEGLEATAEHNIETALQTINNNWTATNPPRILISGSLYLAGDVLACNGTPLQ